ELLGIVGHVQPLGRAKRVTRHLAGRIDMATVLVDLLGAEVVADGFVLLAELNGEGQAHVTESDDADDTHKTALPLVRCGAPRGPSACFPGSGTPAATVNWPLLETFFAYAGWRGFRAGT